MSEVVYLARRPQIPYPYRQRRRVVTDSDAFHTLIHHLNNFCGRRDSPTP